MKDTKRFFADFPPNTKDEWMAKITTDLKGAPFDKKLVWRSPEGFNVQPFYRREDLCDLPASKSAPGEFPYIRSTRYSNEWLVREDIIASSLEEANERALYILNRGVTSLGFQMKDGWISAKSLNTLLKDIELSAIEINFSCCISKAVAMLSALEEYCDTHHINKETLSGSIDYVPFKRELVRGKITPNWLKETKEVLLATRNFPHMKVLMISAHYFSNAGSYITQELGLALSWATDVLDSLIEEGFSLEEIAQHLKFNFGIGPNYFMEIAKFRAARWLWAEIIASHGDQYKGEVAKIHQHATTSTWNMTLYDPHVNLLRTQTEAMSAALGGVDSITVLPFDTTYAIPDDFSLRIARNQQLLLLEESHFDKVIDPGAGSYYIETLTKEIAEKAWEIFLTIEEEGGFAKGIQSGTIQQTVNETNRKRHTAVALRKETLLGTNEFPNFSERKEVAAPGNKSHHSCSVDHSKEENVEALDFSRGASDFEALRLATDSTTNPPIVFMLTIGNLAMRLARSQFAGNFFGCAGYKLIDNLGFDSVEEGVKEALKKNANIIVLCSSDEEYAEYAPELKKLDTGDCQLVIAGNPACREELEKIGFKHFIHVKSDVLETLQSFNSLFLSTNK